MIRWILTFRPEGDGPPDAIRVRRLLKDALRRHRLRCIDYQREDIPRQCNAEARSAPPASICPPEPRPPLECEPCGVVGYATIEVTAVIARKKHPGRGHDGIS